MKLIQKAKLSVKGLHFPLLLLLLLFPYLHSSHIRFRGYETAILEGKKVEYQQFHEVQTTNCSGKGWEILCLSPLPGVLFPFTHAFASQTLPESQLSARLQSRPGG